MAKPGPAKGKGGRPRKPPSKVKARGDGYKRVTVGPKGKGKQVYAHRAAAGVAHVKGSKTGKTGGVVHHKNKRKGDNRRANLKVTTKAENNRRR